MNTQQVPAVIHSIEQRKAQLMEILPPDLPVGRFLGAFKVAALTTKGFLDCDRQSVITAVMKCATDGLVPDGREAALVVHNAKDGNRWIKQLQYYPMVQGLLKRMRNTGEVASVACRLVYEADTFDLTYGDAENVIHKPKLFGDRGPIIGCYSIVKLTNGEISREFMDREQLDAIMMRSKSVDRETGEVKGPWKSDFGEMCRKTVLKRHSKLLPTSARLQGDIEAVEEIEEGGWNDPEVFPEHGLTEGEVTAPGAAAEDPSNRDDVWRDFLVDARSRINRQPSAMEVNTVVKSLLDSPLPPHLPAEMWDDVRKTIMRYGEERIYKLVSSGG